MKKRVSEYRIEQTKIRWNEAYNESFGMLKYKWFDFWIKERFTCVSKCKIFTSCHYDNGCIILTENIKKSSGETTLERENMNEWKLLFFIYYLTMRIQRREIDILIITPKRRQFWRIYTWRKPNRREYNQQTYNTRNRNVNVTYFWKIELLKITTK